MIKKGEAYKVPLPRTLPGEHDVVEVVLVCTSEHIPVEGQACQGACPGTLRRDDGPRWQRLAEQQGHEAHSHGDGKLGTRL